MPSKTLPTKAGIAHLWSEFHPRGFEPVTGLQFQIDVLRKLGIKLQPPTHRTNAELAFMFEWDGYRVYTWTSWIPWLGRAREEDSLWVGIAKVLPDKTERWCYLRQMRRTENHLYRTEMYGKILRRRLMKRPQCPLCECYFTLMPGKNIGSCFWRCESCLSTAWDTKDFLEGLPPEALRFLNDQRAERDRSAKRRKKIEKEEHRKVRRAASIRRGWVEVVAGPRPISTPPKPVPPPEDIMF